MWGEKKTTTGGVPVFLLVFFSLFSFAPHSTIRTPGTSYFSTNSHRCACYTGYKKRKFWGTGNGYTCKMFHLKIGFHFTIMYCENNRENSQSKLVIQENNHHINLSQLQVLEGNQCISYPLQDSLQNYQKKTKYISCWYTLRKIFSFAVTNVSWLVYRFWTMPCRFRVLTQVKTGILDRSQVAPQWKSTVFTLLREKIKNETTTSLFFWENKQGCSPFLFPFLLSFSFPFFLFPRRRAKHFPRLCTLISKGSLTQMTRYNVAKFNPIYFTTKLMSSQCVLDVVESPPVHSCVLIFS